MNKRVKNTLYPRLIISMHSKNGLKVYVISKIIFVESGNYFLSYIVR